MVLSQPTNMFWILIYTAFLVSSFATRCHCQGGASDLRALLKFLFETQGYDRVVRPSRNFSKPTDVRVGIVLNAVLNLDLKQQIMKTTGFFFMEWTDELLQWQPEEHGGIAEFILPANKIWYPDAAIYNTIQSDRYPGSLDTQLRISHTGLVEWAPGFTLETTCKFDVSKYPFDVNICPVRLFAWANDNTSVKLQLFSPPLIIQPVLENGEYEIEPAISSISPEAPASDNKFYDELIFRVKLSRRAGYFLISLLIPVMLLAVLSSASFLLDPEERDKITVSITVLLSFTVFMGVVDQDMPSTSDNISLLLVYVSSMLGVSFFAVFGNVIIIQMDRAEKSRYGCQEEKVDNMFCPSNISIRKDKEGPNYFSQELLSGSDRTSSEKTNKTLKDNARCFGFKCSYFSTRETSTAKTLNRVFFVLNLTFVVCISCLILILMQS